MSAESYRVIQARRSGMTYDKADGQPGALITFTPSKDGYFTRNTVQEQDGVYAEVKAATLPPPAVEGQIIAGA